ncbi:MAG: rhodanese-like domain-containing protein [Nanoarchaeota archaeon]|nr:rhodanese-like domain-containing protein [Nanoarchaeota archaeon]
MKKIILSVVLFSLVLLSACTSLVSHSPQLVSVPTDEFSALIQSRPDAVLLDVRTPEEFQAEHLEGATNIDFYGEGFRDQLDQLDKDQTYLIYCRTGHRSGITLETMRELGFTSVYDLDEGITDWKASGYSTVN